MEFGSVFERYVEAVLNTTTLSILPEREMQKHFDNSKVTDFLIPLTSANLFVEVKAQDIRESVRVIPEEKQLINELGDSIIKGITQAYELAELIRTSPTSPIAHQPDNYLFVLTYRDFYLGTGETMHFEFLESALKEFFAKTGINRDLLPPSHIFVMSVEEFDYFIAAIQSTSPELDIPTFLSSIALADKSHDWQKVNFMFSDNLRQLDISDLRHPLLDAEFQQLTEQLRERFGRAN